MQIAKQLASLVLASPIGKGRASTKSVIEILSCIFKYHIRGAILTFAAAFIQANWRVGSLIASVRVMIRSKYGFPFTTMQKTRADVSPAVIFLISSNSLTPKVLL